MTRAKLGPLPEPTLRTAHDVRHLGTCTACGTLLDDRKALTLPQGMYHGRCFIREHGLRALLALSGELTQHLTLGDLGVDHMRALVNRDPAVTGAKGGKATGARKARDPAHYARLAAAKRERAAKARALPKRPYRAC